jgi:dienelactone hydrolase
MPLSSLPLPYVHAGTTFDGTLYHDDGDARRKPGILLVHGGAGLDAHAHEQARRWATLGYAVLAGDMYGRGVAGDRERVVSVATRLRDDPVELRGRAEAALAVLEAWTDGLPAVVGYCFGGMVALNLARAGAPLAAVVSIHGSLATVSPARPGELRAAVLVCHGGSDPHVPLQDVTAFVGEMEDAGADWKLTIYGGAMHGFTHRQAEPGATPGVEYHERSDRQSFDDASAFLRAAMAAAERR